MGSCMCASCLMMDYISSLIVCIHSFSVIVHNYILCTFKNQFKVRISGRAFNLKYNLVIHLVVCTFCTTFTTDQKCILTFFIHISYQNYQQSQSHFLVFKICLIFFSLKNVKTTETTCIF